MSVAVSDVVFSETATRSFQEIGKNWGEARRSPSAYITQFDSAMMAMKQWTAGIPA